jgi:peptidoglycan/xylan/chitin deacetylase (PgdA/CDA1 family)
MLPRNRITSSNPSSWPRRRNTLRMTAFKTRLIKLALDTLYRTRTYRLFQPTWSGIGAILTLHHVRNDAQRSPFSPNRILVVTPRFLEETIQQLLADDYEIVTLDEIQRRLVESDFESKFVCFTLDDGYADNYYNAFPIFKKYNAPFTVYVNTGLPDGTAILWWWLLEGIVRTQDQLDVTLDGHCHHFLTESVRQKGQAFVAIYWWIRRASRSAQHATLSELLFRYDADPSALCRSYAISWDMISEMVDSGLATIGAHTVNHFALSKLSPEEVRAEATRSRDIISARIGHTPRHFAYPYGDPPSARRREFRIVKELGFSTATTTRKGLLFPDHTEHLHALPRVSLNGEYQRRRYVELFLSGAPFALRRAFQRLDVN